MGTPHNLMSSRGVVHRLFCSQTLIVHLRCQQYPQFDLKIQRSGMLGRENAEQADAFLAQPRKSVDNNERPNQLQSHAQPYEGIGSEILLQKLNSQQHIENPLGRPNPALSPLDASNRNQSYHSGSQHEPISATHIKSNFAPPEWAGSKASKGPREPGVVQEGSNKFMRSQSANGRQVIKDTKQRFDGQTLNKDSKIQYVPFERKVIDYEEKQRTEVVPHKRVVTEYEDKVRYDLVPRVVTKKDYYAVEHIREYVPQQVPEKTVRMVEKKVPYKRVEYVPVTRQVIHPNSNLNQAGQQQAYGAQALPDQVSQPFVNYGGPVIGNQQSFYANYSGNFFTPPQQMRPMAQGRPQVFGQPGSIAGNATAGNGYSMGGMSSQFCRFKLKTHYDFGDHYESYVPSFRY